jgi:hypothetical protein
MWTSGFCIKSPFPLSNVHQIGSIFFVNFNIFHKNGSMCSKHSESKNTYTFLDFYIGMSLNIIIVLTL